MRLYSIFVALMMPVSISAQSWQPNAPDIYFNTGNVGIGISTPTEQLHVASNANHAIKLSRANGLYGFRLYRNAQGGWIHFQNTDDNNNPGTRILFAEGGSAWQNLLLNPDGGNVGIGILSPLEKLHIAGNLHIGDFDAPAAEYTISLPDGRGSVNGGNGRNLTITAGKSDDNASAVGGNLFLRPGFPRYPSNNFGTVFIADAGGKVAIGTMNPAATATLDVNGGIAIRGQTIADVSSTEINFGDISNGDGLRDKLHFYTRDTKRMSIDENGNVGIGTPTPGSFKLAVNGKIWTQEVNVQMTNPGPDYVFEPTYNLLPLSELESYIKANKHLPEVPSAREMEEKGLNLKEMNLLLLKKVEELTLHLIDMQKNSLLLTSQNERLVSEVDNLKNEIRVIQSTLDKN